MTTTTLPIAHPYLPYQPATNPDTIATNIDTIAAPSTPVISPKLLKSARRLIPILYASIQRYEEMGYTHSQICRLLKTQLGIEIAAGTLRGYMLNERKVRKRSLKYGAGKFTYSKPRSRGKGFN